MGPPRVSVPLTSIIRLTPIQSSCGKSAAPQLLMARYPKLSTTSCTSPITVHHRPKPSSAQSSNPLFTQGPLWGPHHLSLGVWGWGQQPAHQLVVRQVSQRLRLIKAFGGKHPLATSGLTCPPRVLPRLGSVHTPTQALQEMESRWTASIQADPTGRVWTRNLAG